jgi:16S rRNA (guanine527-N7)-methyltransferase
MAFECPLEAIEKLVGPISARQEALLVKYAERIATAPRALRVVSRGALAELERHFVDSAAVLSVIAVEGRRVVDLGSGGGLPGVVVAALRPTAEVTLIDSRRSRVAFLKGVQRDLKLPNLEIVRARLEDLGGAREFEVGLSRALGRIETTLAPSLRLVSGGGQLVLFKGPRWQDEAGLAEAIATGEGAELEGTVDVELPGMGRTTTFAVFHVKRRRSASTPQEA